MIGFIDGKLKSILDDGSIIVDVGGIGYVVHAVNFGVLNEGDTVQLFIHTSVREDDISLWGFKTKDELSIFKMLLSVSGVGAKTALNLVTLLGFNEIINAIGSGDAIKLKVKGVGGKTAEKIILELKDKVDVSKMSNIAKKDYVHDRVKIEGIKDALKSLGYKERDIISSISKLANSEIEELSEQELVRLLLNKI